MVIYSGFELHPNSRLGPVKTSEVGAFVFFFFFLGTKVWICLFLKSIPWMLQIDVQLPVNSV